jgi:hypothetical protein
MGVNINRLKSEVTVFQSKYSKLKSTASIHDGGNSITVDDGGGSLTVDGNVTIQEPLSIDDNGGSITIDDGGSSITVDGNVTVQEPLSVDDNGGSLTVDANYATFKSTASIHDGGNSITVDDGGSSLTVDGTVSANQSGVWNINTVTSITNDVNISDGGNSITVDATDLDIRNLSMVQDNVSVYQTSASNLNAQIVGNVAHGINDAGNPVKIGSKAIDTDPSQAEGNNAPVEVIENERVNAWFDRSGRLITGVECRYELLTEIDQTYNDVTTTDTSNAYECWMYRYCTLMFSLESANTPTDFLIEVEVTADGTNWHKLTNDALGDLRYDDTAVSTQIHEAYTFPICAYKIRVKVTATGTDASNTFTLDNTALYLRN